MRHQHHRKIHHTNHHHNLRGPHGHGRHRARRGAVGAAILTLLDEQPMHGYELIGALEDKSGGRWKPSPGSIYPALRKLEQRGLITAATGAGDESGGNESGGNESGGNEPGGNDRRLRRYELTDAGRERLAERGDDAPAPWDDESLGRQGELRRAIAELTGPTKQIGRFGSSDQVAAAVAAVKDTTTKLYQILAEGPSEGPPGRSGSDQSDN